MNEFLGGLMLIVFFGYGLFAIGWIYVAWTEYKFARAIEKAHAIGNKND